MADVALAWLALVTWAMATFTALEHVWPRRRVPVGGHRIALAGALLAIDIAIARQLIDAAGAPALLHGAVGWLVAELAMYGVHRAMHRLPVLWRFHRLHHDEALAWTTAWRVHPVDAALFSGCIALGGAVAGLPTAAWFVVGRRAWTVVLHANIGWPTSPLDHVIATPAFHERHHRDNVNFASTLPAIDRLFGTLGPPESDLLARRVSHLSSAATTVRTTARESS